MIRTVTKSLETVEIQNYCKNQPTDHSQYQLFDLDFPTAILSLET